METLHAHPAYPIRNLRENVAWIEVRDRLRHLGVMVLCIDEVNNLVGTANNADRAGWPCRSAATPFYA